MLALAIVAVVAAPQVELRSSVEGGKARGGWVYARAGQAVTLKAVVSGGPAAQVRWFKVEPTVESLDNTTPSFHFEPVTYRETEVASCRDTLTCPADITPTVLPKVPELSGAGTMAFKVAVTLKDGRTVQTPGAESTKWGGLTAAVHRVTFRKDESLVGYAAELINTPYIFGSAGPDGRNQSDLLIGSDCADLVVYARRRQGRRAEYTSTYTLDQQAPELAKGAKVREGDVVHFPSSRHVGILFRDNEPKGVLDAGDLLFHTCWAPPKVQPMSEAGCSSEPWRVLRFPE